MLYKVHTLYRTVLYVCLVSNSDIRYEGILYTINTQEVALWLGFAEQGSYSIACQLRQLLDLS